MIRAVLLILLTEAFLVENPDRESLESTGISNCKTVIVCIGETIDTSILSPHALDFIRLNDDITVSEIILSASMVGKIVAEADIRRKFNLNIIALEKGEATDIEVRPDYRFEEEDILVVIGKKENMKRFEVYLSEQDEGIW